MIKILLQIINLQIENGLLTYSRHISLLLRTVISQLFYEY